LDAAKNAIDRVDCNQYSPSQGRLTLRKAIAKAYSKELGRTIDPESEVTITTGANEGMLSAFMAFLDHGDEAIVFEPFFDQYISNIEMAGAIVRYVPLRPPVNGRKAVSSAADWTYDITQLKKSINPRTRMIVLNSPHNPSGKIFSKVELSAIGQLCLEYGILILSDEVYDRLCYKPFTRIANLSPEIGRLTLTVGSASKSFYATGWRIGWLIGDKRLISHVTAAHARICLTTVSPLQEAIAIGFEEAEHHDFWEQGRQKMLRRVTRFNAIWDELGLPVSSPVQRLSLESTDNKPSSTLCQMAATSP